VRGLIQAFALCGLIAAPATAATPYRDLFVFGDSLVDSGNARIARLAGGGQDPAPPSLGYFEGRFSNGYNFADYLSFDLFGRAATASLQGGTNFSVGGAQAAEVTGDASPSFLEQIAAFDASGATISSDSLVLLTFGGNDVRTELARLGSIPGYTPSLDAAVSAFGEGLNALFDRGARNVLVTGLPDVGQIPAVTGLGIPALNAAGTQLSFGLNQAFGGLVGDLATSTGYDLRFFDFFAYQKAIYADPSAFGLPEPLNTTQACLPLVAPAPACSGFVYFDPIHPTTQLHRAVADGLYLAAVPEPATWALLIIGFGAAGATARHRRDRVAARG